MPRMNEMFRHVPEGSAHKPETFLHMPGSSAHEREGFQRKPDTFIHVCRGFIYGIQAFKQVSHESAHRPGQFRPMLQRIPRAPEVPFQTPRT